MAEVSGITELQMLEAEIAILEKQASSVQGADSAGVACTRIVKSIQGAESKDGFVLKQGAEEQNQFHSSVGSSAGGDCCVLL
mmetsp:Transcript_27701/g.76230  ORF Transcript_27701/g.76230 Transcript_27701/m.76230 type:complete len:82 (-) Transcript_27701:3576-3821(-)